MLARRARYSRTQPNRGATWRPAVPDKQRMPDRIANIGPRGARRRRRGGIVWLIVAIVALAVLVVRGAPRDARLVLAIPIGLAATGFLQARQKT
jgi:hypothetical protein